MNGDLRTHGLWEASAPPAPRTHPLTERIAVDVAIIGGGFTGSSAALHLAERGASAAVLEAFDIGFGASGRNVGLVNAGMWVMPSVLVAELGKTHGQRLLDLLGNGPSAVFDLVARHGIECEAVHNGTLHCAVGKRGIADVAERARQWLERGAPVELLDAQRTQELTGTRTYAASLLDRRAGTVQPLAYVRGLAAAALRAGARVHAQTRVTAAERVGSEWQLATSSGGTVSAKWVIVATDAYTASNGLWPGIQAEQVQLPYFNFATAPLPRENAQRILPDRQGAWDTRQVLSSFRLDAAGRLVFGSVGALRGVGRSIHRDWARRALARIFPQLKEVPFEHEWYGTIGMTSNAIPRFHELDRNVVSFSGFNGRGIAPGTVLGRELAKFVLGEVRRDDLPLPVTPVVTAPWRNAKALGYEAGAQAFHLVDARI
ncbi:NAD(P)/FAD-dependent oxidoreductase [Caenimonas soli]|uniref:NAD(P)/FAD-dependent oxidoreductase n=1 Tax=Caenimonas soli TaxID=2735555 RepID=UPI0015545CE6|nr:FAD-binding oxidoreductase [Caenimonas soli]NPC58337.1 FAD-binding oxidoreductase [Caenimonas soli]